MREWGLLSEPAAVPEIAVRLRAQLLEVAASLAPDARPVVVREWTDPCRYRDPEPLGHRYLYLVAVSRESCAEAPDFDDALDAFKAAGWSTSRWGGADPAAGRGSASSDGCTVELQQGAGSEVVVLTGWTPVVFDDPGWRQPEFTLSTGTGVLCEDCHGWAVCMDCDGSGRSDNGASWGRCWCYASNYGIGKCIECCGKGRITSDAPWWKRSGNLRPDADPDGADAFRQPPLEHGRDSFLAALTDVAHRPCACGESSCRWQGSVTEGDDCLVAVFTGACQGCAAQRAYAFALPYRKLRGAPPPPPPPPCPRCAGASVPLAGGLHFPGSPMMRAQELGLVARSRHGCQVRPDDPNWRCPECGHEWRDEDRRRLAAVLRAILQDLPDS